MADARELIEAAEALPDPAQDPALERWQAARAILDRLEVAGMDPDAVLDLLALAAYSERFALGEEAIGLAGAAEGWAPRVPRISAIAPETFATLTERVAERWRDPVTRLRLEVLAVWAEWDAPKLRDLWAQGYRLRRPGMGSTPVSSPQSPFEAAGIQATDGSAIRSARCEVEIQSGQLDGWRGTFDTLEVRDIPDGVEVCGLDAARRWRISLHDPHVPPREGQPLVRWHYPHGAWLEVSAAEVAVETEDRHTGQPSGVPPEVFRAPAPMLPHVDEPPDPGACPTCQRPRCTWHHTGECSVGEVAPRYRRQRGGL